jgi:hypothetical protein
VTHSGVALKLDGASLASGGLGHSAECREVLGFSIVTGRRILQHTDNVGADDAAASHGFLGPLPGVVHGSAEHALTWQQAVAPSTRIGLEDDPFAHCHAISSTDTIDYVVTDQSGLTATSTRTVVIQAPVTPSASTGQGSASTTANTAGAPPSNASADQADGGPRDIQDGLPIVAPRQSK